MKNSADFATLAAADDFGFGSCDSDAPLFFAAAVGDDGEIEIDVLRGVMRTLSRRDRPFTLTVSLLNGRNTSDDIE